MIINQVKRSSSSLTSLETEKGNERMKQQQQQTTTANNFTTYLLTLLTQLQYKITTSNIDWLQPNYTSTIYLLTN